MYHQAEDCKKLLEMSQETLSNLAMQSTPKKIMESYPIKQCR